MIINLPKEVQYVINQINASGFSAYLVGGCVRDSLMGLDVSDYDLTTDALPSEVIDVFRGYPVKTTGIRHGTVTVVVGKLPVEITTYRVESSYSDKRHPDYVRFSKSLKGDLMRRDFTMNALAYNQQVGLIDYFGGVEDIKNKVIKCVGVPDDRFEEDALRILRALRFSATLGFTIHREAAESIHSKKDNLRGISTERITAELSKMLCGNWLDTVTSEYFDVLAVIVPELKNNSYNFHEKSELLVKVPPLLHQRLAALFLQIFDSPRKERADMTKRVLKRMKFDSRTAQKVHNIISNLDIEISCDESYVKRLMNELSPNTLRDLLIFKRSLLKTTSNLEATKMVDKMLDVMEKVIEEKECYNLKGLAISGDDVLKLGVKPGKMVGEILQHVLETVIDGGAENEKGKLLKLARGYIENRR